MTDPTPAIPDTIVVAAELESRRLDDYGGNAQNYLNDWARRTGHVDDLDGYEVTVATDPATGFATGTVRAKGKDKPATGGFAADAPPGETDDYDPDPAPAKKGRK